MVRSPSPASVQFGFKLPNCGGVLCPPEWAAPATIDRLANHAADSGFDSLWLHDHLVVPDELRNLGAPSFHEPIATMGWLAGRIPDVMIGIATIILPFRDPVVLMKQMTTLATFHPDRLVFGLGLGRYESEFLRLGLDTYRSRGRVSNSYLQVIHELLSEGPASVETPDRTLVDAVVAPKRVAPGDPAMWIAGASKPGIARAARFADGLILASLPPQEVESLVAALRDVVVEPAPSDPASPAGRAGRITVALSATIAREQSNAAAGARGRQPEESLHVHSSAIRGDAEAIGQAVQAYVDAGVDHFLLSFGVESVERTAADARWFASEVAPHIAARG